MQCPRCHSDCPPEFDFCPRCATPLVVTCPRCGFRAPADFQFCPKCATALAAAGVAAERNAPSVLHQAIERLIPKEYAERLLATRGQARDERRMVTILFSDIKGSTAMISKLDPEDAKEVIQGAFEFLVGPIFRYEGTLVQLMGDAILAFFGAPIAHEDDPERACRAALEITAEAAEYAEKLKRERGIEGFAVRVGINTGLVVVGEVGTDLRVAYTAIGDAINLAARMEQSAEPGTVLITENTHRLIAPLFETQAMPPLQVKGKAEPISTFRVLAARVVTGKVRGVAGLESPLVGREAEFAALQAAVERLKAGVGGIVTIVGEAGLGKSRLVAEVRRGVYPQITQIPQIGQDSHSVIASPPTGGEAISPSHEGDYFGRGAPRSDDREKTARNDREIQWIEGRSLSYGTSIAYLLWLDVVRGLLGVTVEDAPTQVGEKLRERLSAPCGESSAGIFPYLARLLSLPLDHETQARLRDLDGPQLKAGTFDAIEALLLHAATERPLVLVLEDLHWADATSAQLLERLLGLSDRAPLLFVCLFRPQRECPCWHMKEAAARDYPHRHTDLWLNPLSTAESRILLANLLRIEELPLKLQERILAVTEGNPFHVEEVLRALIDQQAIVRDEASGQWRAVHDVADIAIPDTLQGVLMARMDHLNEDARRVLQIAAVIGRIFLYRVLSAIAHEEQQLDQHLLTLQRQELISERARFPELEYIFKHELTREAAYNGLLKKERRLFHRQVAEALERLFAGRVEEQLGLLAYHWERAEDADKATAYLLRAGDQARLAYAHQEAIDYYQRALRFLVQQEEDEQAARTWMKLGLTYHTAFDFQRSREAYEKGFELWQRAGQVPRAVGSATQALHVHAYEPPTLDPGEPYDVESLTIIGQLFSALVQFTPELDVVPDAARSWETMDGGRTYVFHLREDMRWSDGRSVTASDFLYGFQRAAYRAKQTGAGAAWLWSDIKGVRSYVQNPLSDPEKVGVRAPDDATVVIELEEPTSYFLQLLAWAYPLPRHAVEQWGESWTQATRIVTNGPFRLQARQPGTLLVLERNPSYHGRFSGNVQRVEVRILEDAAAEHFVAYDRGDLDIANISFLPPAELERVRQRYAGEYVSVPLLSVFFVGFDVTRSPFSDVRVRRAFVQSVDQGAMLRLSGSHDMPATGGVVPPGMPGHSPGIALPYDPEAARDLLAQAGYGAGGRLRFPSVEFRRAARPIVVAATEYLISQWQHNLGVEIRAESVEWAAYSASLAKSLPHLWYMGWDADYPDPDSFLRAAISQGRRGWARQPYEELLETARRITDQSARMQLYRQADRMVVEEALILPVAYSNAHYLVKPWVKSCPLPRIGPPFWKDVVIERETQTPLENAGEYT